MPGHRRPLQGRARRRTFPRRQSVRARARSRARPGV